MRANSSSSEAMQDLIAKARQVSHHAQAVLGAYSNKANKENTLKKVFLLQQTHEPDMLYPSCTPKQKKEIWWIENKWVLKQK